MKLRTALIFAADVMLFGLSAWSQEHPKWEIPIDYSYVHYQAIDFESHNDAYFYGQYFALEGGGIGFVYNFNPKIGFKGEFQGYGANTKSVTVPPGNAFLPAGGTASVTGDMFTYLFGPQISFNRGKVRPFGEILVGGANTNLYKNAYNNLTLTGVTKAPSNNAFAAAAGIGVDFAVSRRLSLRPLEVDYLYTDFSNTLSANQHSWRYLGGVALTFGGKPPIPPSASCSAAPTEVWAGEPVTATISTLNFNPKHTITYSWSTSGGKVSGAGTTGNVDTTGLAPGSYTISGTATDAKEKKNNIASCTAPFAIKQPHPPTASCSASPDAVKPGDSFTVTVSAASADGRTLSYSYTSSAGTITGTGPSATETTSTANAGTSITATANVVDDRGLSTSCTATVAVEALAVAPPAPVVSEAGSCNFNAPKKPSRVDNECKAALDEVALKIQRESGSSVVVVGYADDTEMFKMPQLAGQRAANVKYYLTAGEGGAAVDASRIQVRAGTVKAKSAKIYLVPSGATFSEDSTPVDETQVKGQPRTATSKKKSKKASN